MPADVSAAAAAGVAIQPLRQADLPDVQRLHKYAQHGSRPVFSQYAEGAAAVLEAAARGEDGAFGLAAWLSDPEEPGEQELVGAVTGQLGSAPVAAEASAPGAELVMLTLVVRADARKRGVGAALLAALIAAATQRSSGALSRVVADVSSSNAPAWRFFERAGFARGAAAAGATTAEAVLQLDQRGAGGSLEPPPPSPPPPRSSTAVAAAMASSRLKARRRLRGCFVHRGTQLRSRSGAAVPGGWL